MARIKFFIQSKNSPAGIYVRLREGRNIDAKAKTKFVVNPNDWNDAKGQPKNLKDANFKKLNEDLVSLSSDLLNYFNKTEDVSVIDSQWLKEFINPTVPTAMVPDKLIAYFDYFRLHKKNLVGTSTYKRNNVYKNLIERFEKSTNSEYRIKDVNADFKLRFEAYCQKQNYSPNTVARTIIFLKTLCYHARSNQIETHFQLERLSVKYEKVEKIHLTINELEKIENKEMDSDYLKNAKDWLIISCETGQRVSDFMRFTKEQIRYVDDKPIIEFTQVKTKKIMAIPLSKKVMLIIERLNGDFPRRISDQRYNEYIKEVCRIAEINEFVKGSKLNKETNRKESGIFPKFELVTSHIGRRSFATNNYGRIPTPLLMNVTGHSTEKMFLEYMGKTSTDKAIQLAEYFT